MPSPSPISRTITELIRLGYSPVEKTRRLWGPRRRRRSLYGFCDIQAGLPGVLLAVRVIGPSVRVNVELCRLVAHPNIVWFTGTGGRVEIWQWRKRGRWHVTRTPVCPPSTTTAVRQAADPVPAISAPERDFGRQKLTPPSLALPR